MLTRNPRMEIGEKAAKVLPDVLEGLLLEMALMLLERVLQLNVFLHVLVPFSG